MSKDKHTPGKWNYDEDSSAVFCGRERGVKKHTLRIDIVEVCRDDPAIPKHEARANGRLIAAAPDMYEALVRMMSDGLDDESRKLAMEAVRKARQQCTSDNPPA